MLGKNLITSSLVLYKTKLNDLESIIHCVINSNISKLFIIDNSPTDELRVPIESLHNDKIEYSYRSGNIGYGNANNLGIQKAIDLKSKYHIVLNPDIIFEPTVVDILSDYMDEHDDTGQILPTVKYPDGSFQYLCKLLPHPIDIFGRRFFPSKLLRNRNYKFEMHFMGYDKVWNCPLLSGCFMFIRTSVLEKVGGFDPRFFMYFEDFDLMRRIHNVSKTVFYPYVSIIHNHAAGHRHNLKLLRESIKSACKYFNKWGWFFDIQRTIVNKTAMSDQIEIS